MTNAVAEKPMQQKEPKTAEAGPYRELYSGDFEIARIVVESNHRKHFNETALKELADSIAKVGLLEPIILRYHRDGKNGAVLVAGERRLRAAKLGGLKTIKARVLDVDEAQAEELQALENLHRESLGPIEEARAFDTLLKLGKYDVKSLAARLDKSTTYVYQALALLELPAAALQAIESGDLTPAHGHQILRAAPKYRETLTKFATTKYGYSGRLPTVHELRDQVDRSVEKQLSDAPFPKDRPYAGEVACSTCPFNSSNQEDLLGGDVEKSRCLNPGCYSKKKNEYERGVIERAGERFEGLKFVGAEADRGYYSNRDSVKGFAIVSEEIQKLPAIKKLLKDKPQVFGYGIIKPGGYSSFKVPKAVLVAIDQSAVNAVLPKDKAVSKPASIGYTYQAPKPKTEKEKFLEEALEKGLTAVVEKAILAAPESKIVEYFSTKWGRIAWKRKSIESKGLDVKKLKAADVLRLLFWEELDSNGDLGVNTLELLLGKGKGKAAQAQLVHQAEAEWAKKHPEKKPAPEKAV